MQCISKIGVKCQENEVLLLQQNFWVGNYYCSKIHIFKHSVLWTYVILYVFDWLIVLVGEAESNLPFPIQQEWHLSKILLLLMLFQVNTTLIIIAWL